MDCRRLRGGAQGIDCFRVHIETKRAVQEDAHCPIEFADGKIFAWCVTAIGARRYGFPARRRIFAHTVSPTHPPALPTTTIALQYNSHRVLHTRPLLTSPACTTALMRVAHSVFTSQVRRVESSSLGRSLISSTAHAHRNSARRPLSCDGRDAFLLSHTNLPSLSISWLIVLIGLHFWYAAAAQ